MTYINGVTPGTRTELTFPCHYCGLVLPRRNITLTFIFPWPEGDTRYTARAFRTIGLAVDSKSPYVHHTHHAQIYHQVTNAGPPPFEPPLQKLSLLEGGTQTLNERGLVIYTLLRTTLGSGEIARHCARSFLSIVPLCSACYRATEHWRLP
uniref:Uncharacterized protein n=1 Tax=Candidatus Kentrum sp. DK TaxID=2126562 RepID=A0A450SJS7_9GAMM|nr:MAG: hypothetical protein BECKDK2373B_GA0170837_104334 [Candidatus Kentron sp. DK]